VNVSGDAGVGGRLFGGPVANAATSAAPAAATAASIRRSVTKKPTAFSPVDLNPVATANAQINSAFDALANLLKGLPQGPVADFLGGALLTVRRTLFNQAPTANPVQYGQTQTDIVGTLGAVDVEGDAITYTVSQAPEHGTVSIAADGSYTYTPDALTPVDSSDAFTVSISDAAPRLLGAISNEVVVPVAIVGTFTASPLPGFGTQGFDIYNWTSGDLTYIRAEDEAEEIDGGSKIGDVVSPGHLFHFEIKKPNFSNTTVRPVFESESGAIWAVNLQLERATFGPSPSTGGCYPSNQCHTGETKVEFLDPANTVITVPLADKEKQANIINGLCIGGQANCSYDVTKVVDKNAAQEQYGNPVINDTPLMQGKTYTATFSESATTSWDVSATAKTTLFKLVETQLALKYARSYTSTASYSETKSLNAPAYSYGVITVQPGLTDVTGNVVIKLGNTTWNLNDVQFSYPNQKDCTKPGSGCKGGSYTLVTHPLRQGFSLTDPKASTNSPVYYVGDNPVQLQARAYIGQSNPPFADYTTNKGVQYASSNPSVATVSALGVLTLVGPGTATITARYSWEVAAAKAGDDFTVQLPIEVRPSVSSS
jgi:hypothetical protein